MKHLSKSLKESVFSVLLIAAIVLILSVSLAPINAGVVVLFLFGTLLLIFGMSFFTIGSGISMQEEAVMKNEHKHYLVMITVNRGYTDTVMEVAKKAGATGGTVIKGRLAESEKLKAITEMEIDEERESIIILAPADVSARILEDVNEKYGLKSKARGILCALPVEKAYKI